MSDDSCIAAGIALLRAGVPSLSFLVDTTQAQPTLPSDLSPAVLLDTSNVVESRQSGGIGGWKRREFDLQMHLWSWYSDLDSSALPFRQLRQQVEAVFRTSFRLNGLADQPPNSFVLLSADGQRGQRTKEAEWVESNGMILRHAVIDVAITEIVVG